MRKRIISLISVLMLLTTTVPTVAHGATKGAIASGGSISSVYVYTVDSSGTYTFAKKSNESTAKKGTLKGHITAVTAEVGDRIVIKGDQTAIYWCSNGASKKSKPSVTPNETEGTIDWYGYSENTSSKIWTIEGEVTSINTDVYDDRNLNYNLTVSHTMTYSSSVYNVAIGNITIALENPRKIARFNIDGKFTKMSADSQILLLSESGNVYGLGNNYGGKLGLGDEVDRTVPTKIPGVSNIKDISAGGGSYLLTEDNEVYVMGWNYYGGLGLGHTDNVLTPTKLGITDVKMVAAGSNYAILVKNNGDVYVTGYNSDGQLGLGHTDTVKTWTKLSLTEKIKAASAGAYHSLLLTESGEVYSMGRNSSGELGLGKNSTLTDVLVPTKIPDIIGIKEIATGRGSHSFLLSETGEVYAMGNDSLGSLGLSRTSYSSFVGEPTKMTLSGIKTIAAGEYHVVLLNENNEVYSAGYNEAGQLGWGNTTTKINSTPGKISLSNVVGIAAGKKYTLLVTTSGEVYATGDKSYWGASSSTRASVMDGTGLNVNKTRLVIPEFEDTAGQIDKTTFKFAFDKKGEKAMQPFDIDEGIYLEPNFNGEYRLRVYAKANWGPDINKVYTFTVKNAPKNAPIVKLDEKDNISAYAGTYSTFLVNENGEVYVMGNSSSGELGLGDNEDRLVPTKLELSSVKAISGGWNHSLFLTEAGDVYAVGDNAQGELGLGDTENRTTPTKLSLDGIKAIAAGCNRSMFLTNDGQVYATGQNTNGELGLGDTTNRSIPELIPNLSGIKEISMRNNYALFLTEAGEVYALGNNSNGQLGLGDTTNRIEPTKLSVSGITAIDAGDNHSLLLSKNGVVYAMGNNDRGDLGVGDLTDRTTPTQIPNIPKIKAISAGIFHSLFLTEDGQVYVTGQNSKGELGLGDTITRKSPELIPNISDIEMIAGGAYQTVLINSDGDVYVAGSNGNGELGLGDTENRTTPTKIPNFSLKVKTSYPMVRNLIIIDEALSEIEKSYYTFISESSLAANDDEVPNNLWVPFDVDIPAVFLAPSSNDTYYLYVKLDYADAKSGELVYRDGESHTLILGPFTVTTVTGNADSYSYISGDIRVRSENNPEFNLVFQPSQDMTLGNTDTLFSDVFNSNKIDIQLIDKNGNTLACDNYISEVYKNGLKVENITPNYVFTKRDSGASEDNVYVLRVNVSRNDGIMKNGETYQLQFNSIKGISTDGANLPVSLNSHPFTMMVYVSDLATLN